MEARSGRRETMKSAKVRSVAVFTAIVALGLLYFTQGSTRSSVENRDALRFDKATVSDGALSEGDDVVEPEFKGVPTEAVYSALFKKQVDYCGKLCSYDPAKIPQGPLDITVDYLKKQFIRTPVQCPKFFSLRSESLYDGPPLEWPPPEQSKLPYTYPGEAFEKYYFQQRYEGGEALISRWSTDTIDRQLAQLRSNSLDGTYGVHSTNNVHGFLRTVNLRGLRVLVVGSEKPWLEVICVELGAESVTTLEYGKIVSDHPKIKTLVVKELNELFRQGNAPQFDIAVTFSSLEHSGLGRYGDRMNPWGDVIWMAKISCLVKPGGRIAVGMPYQNVDKLFYNAHRVYGPWRWPLMLQNWAAVETFYEPSTTHMIVVATNERE